MRRLIKLEDENQVWKDEQVIIKQKKEIEKK